MMPSTAVLIANYKRSDLLARTLESLRHCRLPERFCGVYVVENGAKGTAQQVCEAADRRLQVQYLYHEEANKSRALNYALTQMTSDLVIFFDDDVRLHADTLVAYERAAQQHPRCYFGGPLEIDYERPPRDWLIPYLPHSARGWHFEAQNADDRPVFLGANQAAFRAALREVGGFDPTVGPGRGQGVGEDTRIQSSLSAAGYQPHYIPEAVVWHYVPVEACSPTWALERAYRQALTFGESLQDDTPRLLGAPRWMLREWLEKRLRLWKLVLRRASEPERFAARVDERRLRGWIDGFRRRPPAVTKV